MFKQATDRNGGQVNAANAAQIAQTVLASLAPSGRSGLFTQKQETELKNKVENINPEKDLYKYFRNQELTSAVKQILASHD